jgi:type IV pilus assembly protein PilW
MSRCFFARRSRTDVRGPVRGFTVIEMAVVLALSVAVLGMILQIFSSNRENALVQDNLARMQENARIAVQALQEGIRVAGFAGEIQEYWNIEFSTTQPVGTVSGECFDRVSSSGFRWVAPFVTVGTSPPLVAPKLYGVNGMTNSTIGDFAGCLQANGFASGTDVLSLHYVGPETFADSAFAITANNLYVRANLFNGLVFRSNGSTPPSDSWAGGPNTAIYPLQAAVYFARGCSNAGANNVCGDTGDDSIPSLVRKSLQPSGTLTTEVVAEGVVGFQVRYGIDTNATSDGTANRYVDAGHTKLPAAFGSSANWPSWAKVRTVRVWLLMRSEARFAGYQDPRASYTLADTAIATEPGYRYQLFVTTVALRNASGDEP